MIKRLLFLAGAGLGALLLGAGPLPVEAAPVTESFEFTGGPQDFVVPAGVCEVTVDVFGAEGGDFGGPITAGLGGRATATFTVTPAETLQVNVGEEGQGDGSAAFNGGGEGGIGTENSSNSAGGGGGSDVRQGGTALTDRVVVAGGGGGRSNGGGTGGDGGGEEGDPGGGAGGGPGGTQTAGGVATGNGGDGALGIGGDGGDDTTISGGGGGGGYFGGAGGSADPSTADAGGGGGGSGSGPAGTTFETGVRSGDGLVEITYDAAAGTCPEEPAPTGGAPVAAEPGFTG